MLKRPSGRRTPSTAAVARPRCPTCRSSASTVVERVIRGDIGKLEITCRKCGRSWTAPVSRTKHSKYR